MQPVQQQQQDEGMRPGVGPATPAAQADTTEWDFKVRVLNLLRPVCLGTHMLISLPLSLSLKHTRYTHMHMHT